MGLTRYGISLSEISDLDIIQHFDFVQAAYAMSLQDELKAKEIAQFSLPRKDSNFVSRELRRLQQKIQQILLIHWSGSNPKQRQKNSLTPEKQKEMIKSGYKITKRKKVQNGGRQGNISKTNVRL